MMMSGLSSALVRNFGLGYQEEKWNMYPLEAKANMSVFPGGNFFCGSMANGKCSIVTRVTQPGPPSAATAPSGKSAERVKSRVYGASRWRLG